MCYGKKLSPLKGELRSLKDNFSLWQSLSYWPDCPPQSVAGLASEENSGSVSPIQTPVTWRMIGAVSSVQTADLSQIDRTLSEAEGTIQVLICLPPNRCQIQPDLNKYHCFSVIFMPFSQLYLPPCEWLYFLPISLTECLLCNLRKILRWQSIDCNLDQIVNRY